jgi:hypothetical protein
MGYRPPIADHPDKIMPVDPRDLADALAPALRYRGRKRTHNADEIMAEIVRSAFSDARPVDWTLPSDAA